jgi:type I restriction enzyme S subunit
MKNIGRLSDIYVFQYGKGNENPDNGGIYPVYGSNGIIGSYDKFNSDDAPVIGHIGANAGSVVFAKGKHFVTYNGVICKIKDCADKMYGYYALLSSNLKKVAFGSAQPFVSYNSLNRIVIYLPSSEKQKKIANILSTYDELIENNNKRIKLLEQIAENLYKEWFVRFRFLGYENAKFENGIPKGWEYVKFKDILSFDRGISYSSEEIDCDDGLNLINLKNIDSFGGFRRDGTKKYNGKYKESQVVKKGDLVIGVTDMTQDRRTVGAAALIPTIKGTSVISADLVKVVSDIPNIYLYCLCRYGFYSKYFSQFANGANVLHLKPGALLNKKVLLPTKDLTDDFVEKVSALIELIDELNLANDNIIKQRDLLLPRLMSGKLEV